MIHKIGEIFHENSKNNLKKRNASLSNMQNSIEYKEYSRFEKVYLPDAVLSLSFDLAIKERVSTRVWSGQPISIQEVSNLLFYSCGITKKALDPNKSKRSQASAGNVYPIEIYLINFIEGEIKKGVYHYAVKDHSLEALWPLDETLDTPMSNLFTANWPQNAAMLIVATGVTTRYPVKLYGREYRYMYMEAGAIAQLINVASDAQNIGCTIMGETNDENVQNLLNLNEEKELFLTGILVGKKK